jgi:hypothetical protein
MELESVARRVDEVGVSLVDAARRIDVSHPRAAACGAGASGALGQLGQAWAARMSSMLVARADEAHALAAATSDLAGAAGLAAAGYRAVESRRDAPGSHLGGA